VYSSVSYRPLRGYWKKRLVNSSFVVLVLKNDQGVNFMYWFIIQGIVRGSKELN